MESIISFNLIQERLSDTIKTNDLNERLICIVLKYHSEK